MAPLAGQAIHQRQGADHHVCDGRRLVESLMQFRYLRALYPRERQAAQGLGIPDFDWTTLGYRLEAEGKIVAISGDTIPCEGLDRLARGADVLVLCCYLAEAEVIDAHAERLTRHLFLSSAQAGKIAASAGVKKLVLTHFRAKPESLMRAIEEDVRRDFDGEVILGRDLLEVEV